MCRNGDQHLHCILRSCSFSVDLVACSVVRDQLCAPALTNDFWWVPTPTIWSTHLLISVEQAGSLLVGTDFFRLLLLLGPALSDSYSVWPHVSKCAALNFRIVWWSRRKSLLAPSLTSSSLWLKGRVAAWCAVEYTFVLRIGWNILNWLLLTVKLLLKL